MNNKIGNALKVLRNRAGLSQFQLEMEAGLSTSTITRIENGQINPTKETLLKLVSILNLNQYESMYLMGITLDPANDLEIQLAYNEVKGVFENTNSIAYLVDERWRALKTSKRFFTLLGLSEKDFEKFKYQTIISILISRKFPVRDTVDPKYFQAILKSQLPRYYLETSFMENDKTFLETVDIINADPVASEIWKEVVKNKGNIYHEEFTRTISFKIGPVTIPLIYSREPLSKWLNIFLQVNY